MSVDYDRLIARVRELVAEERDAIANCANVSAAIAEALPNLNWVGFYLVRDGVLVLGPFQGKPATTRIARGAGVCGTAWERGATIVVEDVHAFEGHIACDPASNAEVVVPVYAGSRVVAVLDVDSPVRGRFASQDATALEAIAGILSEASDFG